RAFRGFLELGQRLALASNRDVFRRETALDIHPKFALGQIAYVPHRSFHGVASAEVLSDRLCLGGRFNHHQRVFVLLCHSHSVLADQDRRRAYGSSGAPPTKQTVSSQLPINQPAGLSVPRGGLAMPPTTLPRPGVRVSTPHANLALAEQSNYLKPNE